jgi:CubicO group peptidase (beta-lactamase class C family)
MAALQAISGWGAPAAGAAVVGRNGVVESAGATGEVLRLASVTKLLVAYAALVAVEEGTVTLDDDAGPPGATLRHLLAHASGLGPDDRSRRLARPATRRIYSNAGTELAAEHVAARANMPFEAYLSEGVLQPLGMDDVSLRGSPAAFGYGSVDDLCRFAGELLAPTLVSTATLAEATTVAFPGLRGVIPGLGRYDPCDWGLGFEIRDGKAPHWTGTRNSPQTFGHFGGSGTFLWVDPAVRLACIVLTDREFGPWALDAWPTLSDTVLATHAHAKPA